MYHGSASNHRVGEPPAAGPEGPAPRSCYREGMETPLAGLTPDRVRRFRRDEYERMVEVGLFAEQRVELLYGVIVTMSPQKAPHAHPIRTLNMILAPALVGRAEVQVQIPLAVSDDSEPEPDLSVVASGDYLDELPRTALLVVEVAGDSLRTDREIKGRLYAETGIPEYWLIDLRRNRLERYLRPESGVYTQMTTHGRGETLHPTAFPDVAVALDRLLRPTPIGD